MTINFILGAMNNIFHIIDLLVCCLGRQVIDDVFERVLDADNKLLPDVYTVRRHRAPVTGGLLPCQVYGGGRRGRTQRHDRARTTRRHHAVRDAAERPRTSTVKRLWIDKYKYFYLTSVLSRKTLAQGYYWHKEFEIRWWRHGSCCSRYNLREAV